MDSTNSGGCLERDFFLHPSPTHAKNTCFSDVAQPWEEAELFRGFGVVQVLSKE
jgi:hypothetical protein